MGILANRISGIKRRLYAPSIKVTEAPGLVRLGSRDCGLTLQPTPDLMGATIISAGLGEDGSFDCEFAVRFKAKVVIVDPTPRSIAHFRLIEAALGRPRSRPYAEHGAQPIESYDLLGLQKGSMEIEPSALWPRDEPVKFHAPTNPAYVSYSALDLDGVSSAADIEVPGITVKTLLAKHGLNSVPLMKFDIEGAESLVIPQMLRDGILPRQMLVEYDEMIFPSAEVKRKTEATHRTLVEAGYTAMHFNGYLNYLYIRN